MDCETKEVQAPDVLMLELEGCVVHPKQEKDLHGPRRNIPDGTIADIHGDVINHVVNAHPGDVTSTASTHQRDGWSVPDAMANVIERLRVTGNPAPRNPTSALSARGKRRKGEGEGEPQTEVFVLNSSLVQNRDATHGRRMNQAARRLEHLHRIQHANQGLSSMDASRGQHQQHQQHQQQTDLAGKQFMLRGKPASAEVALLNRHYRLQQQQQSASSGGSGRSGRAGMARQKALSDGEGAKNHHSQETFISQSSHPHHLSNANPYFVLAHPNTMNNLPTRGNDAGTGGGDVHPATASSKGKGGESGRQGRSGKSNRVRIQSPGSTGTLELTGRQVVTPRSTGGFEDGFSSRDFYTRSPRTGRGTFRERSMRSPGMRDATVSPVDQEGLRNCLHVHPSTAGDPCGVLDPNTKFTHLSQFLRADTAPAGHGVTRSSGEAKVNYNNPYRQSRIKDRKPLPESERRYIFDSVASYIHFNKIYPQSKDASRGGAEKAGGGGGRMTGLPSTAREGLGRVPQMAGFPNHCTDTILLRMMVEMNRPGAVHGIGIGHQAAGAPSIRSGTSVSNKYSDVGRQRDLDEFQTQGETPSITSARTLHHQQQKSNHPNHQQQQQQQQQQSTHRSGAAYHAIPSPPKEEDEDDKDKDENEGTKLEDEDESTLRTATTPGRRPPDDDDDEADDADDEASTWNNDKTREVKITEREEGEEEGGGGGGEEEGDGDREEGEGDGDAATSELTTPLTSAR